MSFGGAKHGLEIYVGRLLIFIFLLMIGTIIFNIIQIYNIKQDIHNIKMYNALWQAQQGKAWFVEGLYYNTTICIDLEDQKWDEVMETCSHEWEHYRWGKHYK